jgi:aldose sugar dehydrogenase
VPRYGMVFWIFTVGFLMLVAAAGKFFLPNKTPKPAFARTRARRIPSPPAWMLCAAILPTTFLSAQVGGPPPSPSTGKTQFRVEILAEGLETPWGITELPDGRFLITERSGHVRILGPNGLEKEKIDNFPPIFARGQGGLLDVALHPDYEKNGWIYFAYSADEDGVAHTRILRARLGEGELKDQEQIYSPPLEQFGKQGHHFGCRLAFGKDGMLYFSIGDRGVMQSAQDLSLAAGKIHRIRDDGSIPADNPFLNTPGALPSIWAYGTRNAQGLRFDPETGLLWETEHGPRGGDELNIIRPGKNYGWPTVTYGINYNGTPITEKTSAPGMEEPVTQWTPSIAVCGLEVLSGRAFPSWKGNLFATALAHQKLVRLEVNGEEVTGQEILLERSGRIRQVREASDGSILLLYEQPGRVVRLSPANG